MKSENKKEWKEEKRKKDKKHHDDFDCCDGFDKKSDVEQRAIDTLVELLNHPQESIRLEAAALLLEYSR